MSASGLTVRATVADLCAVFASAERDVRAAFASIVAAQARVNAAFTLGGNLPIRVDASRHGYHDSFDEPEHAIERMRRAAWGVIVDRLELRRMLSIKRYERLVEQIEKETPPELTEENVNAFVLQYAADLPTMIRESVVEVFEWLRPHYSEHKTNSELEIGPRVVLGWMVERAWNGPGYRVDYRRGQHLIALENVFSSLDGKGSFTRTHYSELQNAIQASPDGHAETEYFEAKCYKNRNMHLRFKRLDLLQRLNQIAGGANLRPAQAKAS